MKTLKAPVAIPNINRHQVVSAAFDPDADEPCGEIRIRFLCVGGNYYGPDGTSGDNDVWSIRVVDAVGGSGNISKNASPKGVRDILIRQPNPNSGVFTACWNAWRTATNTKTARNLALEEILTNAGIGILSTDLAGT